jgi:type IV secretory pathway TraG/TraD family ATPase VirD4
MGRDITSPASALQTSSLLIPEERAGTGNPFFVLAAQNLLRGVLLSFLQTVGTDWTFRDVLLALRFEERMCQVLEKTMEGRAILDQFFQPGETLQGIRAMLATKLAPFEVIVAAWDTATEKVSLAEFIEGEFVLVLGNDESTRTALDAINRVLFQRLSELILSQDESRTRQTWLFLDEVREAGRLEGLSRLMTKGRSKGACVALGFQAIEGMREVYGNNVAAEIAGLCNNKAILRLESPVSAQWGSSLFDKVEEIDRRESRSWSRNGRGILPSLGRSRTLAEQRLTTDAVMASEIMTLPPTGPENGLNGYFMTRARGAYTASIPWNQLKWMPNRPEVFADVSPRPESSQYLREWTSEDLERLGLQPVRLVTPSGRTGLNQEIGDNLSRTLRRVRESLR